MKEIKVRHLHFEKYCKGQSGHICARHNQFSVNSEEARNNPSYDIVKYVFIIIDTKKYVCIESW